MRSRPPRCGRPRFAALRTWAQWWADEARLTPCCLWASDDELETDPDAYDCEACPVLAGLSELDADNREAWTVFQRVATRFAHDFRLAAVVLAPVLAEKSPDDQADLLARLTLLYDTLYPPPAKDRDHGA